MTLSLRGRLLIGVISLVVIGLLVANVATYLSLQKFLVGRVDDQLRSGVAEVSTELGAPGPSSNRSTAFPPGTVAELLGTDGSVVKTKVAESGFGTTTSAVTPVLPTALPSKGLDTPADPVTVSGSDHVTRLRMTDCAEGWCGGGCSVLAIAITDGPGNLSHP